MNVDRDTVMAALRAEDVAHHLGIKGQWRGRWMRSSRCAAADHSSDAFGLARDGKWHCWACDTGGDLIKLLAIGEGLDVRSDFSKVLEIAAKIAGVEPEIDFGGARTQPAPKTRPEPPPLPKLADRIAMARRRALWVWQRLTRCDEYRFPTTDLYLSEKRGLDAAMVRMREDLRETPMAVTIEECSRAPDLKSLAYTFAAPGVAFPVRSPVDGALVDIRVRRFMPREGQPKIVGMLGGITAGPAEDGKARQLLGCYGHPEHIDSDLVVIVEGALDYATALACFPNAQILGAVEAGSLALVTAHAARCLAQRDGESRILIVEQNDPPRTLKDGRIVAGAADASVNEDPNAATKVAVRILGPRRVGWLMCQGEGIKDLNDLVTCDKGAGRVRVSESIRWWTEIGEGAA